MADTLPRFENRNSQSNISAENLRYRAFKIRYESKEEELSRISGIFNLEARKVKKDFSKFQENNKNRADAVILFTNDIHPDFLSNSFGAIPFDVQGHERFYGQARINPAVVKKILDEPNNTEANALMYDYYVITQARQMIEELAPSLKNKLEIIFKTLVIYESYGTKVYVC